MSKETDEQILQELKEINQSLQEIKEQKSEPKPPTAIGSFLTGFISVAAILIVVIFIFRFISG